MTAIDSQRPTRFHQFGQKSSRQDQSKILVHSNIEFEGDDGWLSMSRHIMSMVVSNVEMIQLEVKFWVGDTNLPLGCEYRNPKVC